MQATEGVILFGQHVIRNTQVFFRSPLSLGLVNLMPIVPGHVLIIPRRPAKRLADLGPAEVADLFQSAVTVSKGLEKYYQAEALTMAVQDGAAAGQTVGTLCCFCCWLLHNNT
eukprot:TRINITY_DN9605_c0_g1_i2.p1 TRINITY_DN9605_c0_g1~~TRINITY_DN9605_c0_g1_i2.p1  ORF type:complete len:113 (-),score=13.90 TRINITY_DN9605_c0_g1_i2:259-597(-)